MEADKEELSVDYRPAGVRRRLWRMPVFGLIEQKTAIRPAGVKTMIEIDWHLQLLPPRPSTRYNDQIPIASGEVRRTDIDDAICFQRCLNYQHGRSPSKDDQVITFEALWDPP